MASWINGGDVEQNKNPHPDNIDDAQNRKKARPAVHIRFALHANLLAMRYSVSIDLRKSYTLRKSSIVSCSVVASI